MPRPQIDRLDVRRLDQIEALASPIRSKILLALSHRGPASAREIAARVGLRPNSIHYHLRALVEADLVRVREKRSIGPRSEAVYEAVARVLRVDRRKRSHRFLAAMKKAIRAGLRLAEREFEAALGEERFATGTRRRELQFQQQDVRLRPADLREFLRRLDDARQFATEHHDPERGRWLTITTMITPGQGKTDI